MLDNRHRTTSTIALHPLAGIACRLLRRSLGGLHTLKSDIQPGVVHHGEHGAHTRPFRADQFPHAIVIVAKGQHASG